MSQDDVEKKKRKIWKTNFPLACFQAVRLLFYKMSKVWLNPKRIYENQKSSFRKKKKRKTFGFLFLSQIASALFAGV